MILKLRLPNYNIDTRINVFIFRGMIIDFRKSFYQFYLYAKFTFYFEIRVYQAILVASIVYLFILPTIIVYYVDEYIYLHFH